MGFQCTQIPSVIHNFVRITKHLTTFGKVFALCFSSLIYVLYLFLFFFVLVPIICVYEVVVISPCDTDKCGNCGSNVQ